MSVTPKILLPRDPPGDTTWQVASRMQTLFHSEAQGDRKQREIRDSTQSTLAKIFRLN